MGLGEATGVAAAGSDIDAAIFPTRRFFLSGLTCRATLSQSVRSSSLRWRRPREGADKSGRTGGRFI
jgi:hypothetical protein